MPQITSDMLAAFQRATTSTLVTPCTNSRTGVQVKCRVTQGTGRQMRFSGTPVYDRQRAFQITLPVVNNVVTDVVLNDVLTVTGLGTYVVLQRSTPQTYATAVIVDAIQTLDANGNPMPYLITNSTVTFSRTVNGVTQTIANAVVSIEPSTDKEMILAATAVQTVYELFFDPSIVYPDSTPVRTGDRIQWLYATGWRPLSKVTYHPGPLPYAKAFFTDVD